MNNIEPVRLYAEDDIRLPRVLAKFLKDRINDISIAVLQGQLTDQNYRFCTGQISGLREALQECERIDNELTGN